MFKQAYLETSIHLAKLITGELYLDMLENVAEFLISNEFGSENIFQQDEALPLTTET